MQGFCQLRHVLDMNKSPMQSGVHKGILVRLSVKLFTVVAIYEFVQVTKAGTTKKLKQDYY